MTPAERALLQLTAALFLPACGLLPTPEPTPTATPTATPAPSATFTPAPTNTLVLTETPEPADTSALIGAAGGTIAYTQYGPGMADIVLLDAATGERTPLTDGSGFAVAPRWSPDGSFISYYSFAPNQDAPEVWVAELGSEDPPRRVHDGADVLVSLPVWSPDNRYLISWGYPANSEATVILRIEVQSGLVANLTPDYGKWNAFPAWSPDGSRIAFVTDRIIEDDFTDKIWVMGANGQNATNVIPIKETLWEDGRPAWSPDGTEIAFFRTGLLTLGGDEIEPGIWAIAPDGSGERLIYGVDLFRATSTPVWSPDGAWIAFQTGLPDETDIWVVAAAGGEAIQISDFPGAETDVSWSPDSQLLLFTYESPESNLYLYVAAPDGGPPQLLTDDGASGFADWGP